MSNETMGRFNRTRDDERTAKITVAHKRGVTLKGEQR